MIKKCCGSPEGRPPSKSARKREAQSLQDLGERLTMLPEEELSAVDLPEHLREAVNDYAGIRSFGARRRQLQLIGKIMRSVDADAVRASLEEVTAGRRGSAAAHHLAEKTRDEVISSDAALDSFMGAFHPDNAAGMRSLVLGAREERARGKNGTCCRSLYRLIFACQNPPGPACPGG